MHGDVVLLHGLGGSPLSLLYAGRRLREAGFTPLRISYPSRHAPIDELARFVAARLPAAGRPLHFLTHSMGGIVLRQLVKTGRPAHIGRAVMLGPPNGGSQLATRMSKTWIYRRVMGPAGLQIGADAASVPNTLGPVDFPVGVIAGHRALDPFRLLVTGESDGKVCLSETRVEGMTDWLCVERSHALLHLDPAVIGQAIHFLCQGSFARPVRAGMSDG
jgi:triacylglycerol lipase